MMRKILFTMLGLVPSTAAGALGLHVTMQTLNLEFEFASMQLPWGTIVHQYESRTVYDNALGVGWCNAVHVPYGESGDAHIAIETKAIVARDTITIERCGTDAQFGDIFLFRLRPEDAKEQGNEDLREFATRLGRPIELYSPNLPRIPMTVTAEGIRYNPQSNEKTEVGFDWNGNLTRIGDIKVQFKNAELKSLSGPGGSVDFIYQGDRLARLKSDKGYEAYFTYRQDGALSKIDNAWKKVYEFDFNDGRNLQMLRWPDQTQITAFYDDAKDTVTTIMDRDGCTEEYSHISGQDRDNYKVQAVRSCNGKQVAERTVTYHFKGDDVETRVNDVTPGKDKSQLKAFYGTP